MEFSGKGTPLTPACVNQGIADLGIDAATFWAVMAVETRGFGFLADRRPLILFERHVFHARTGGKFDLVAPDLSKSSAGGYGAGGANQYKRLGRAIALDRKAALESASWGVGQVMGFNAAVSGFADAEAMVAAMIDAEDRQARAMTGFILSNGLATFLRKRQWAEFARRYNGPDFKKNNYDVNLAKAFNRYSVHLPPDLTVRTCQAALLYLGFNPNGVDGVFGFGTQKALIAWQKARNRVPDGNLSDKTRTDLITEAFPD